MNPLLRLLALPAAPIDGVLWLASRLEEIAERETYGEPAARAALADARRRYDDGALTHDEYTQIEEAALARLMDLSASRDEELTR